MTLAGRAEPDLPLARSARRARSAGYRSCRPRVSFGGRRMLLLRESDVRLSEEDVMDLVESTEGWPIGLYLAALSIEAGGESSVAGALAGDDAVVADYLRSELLDRQPPKIASFLTRTSVLDEMCGSICDEVLGVTGSTRTLESIARQNLLVTPLDRRQEWFRYHHLFRDLLLSELQRQRARSRTQRFVDAPRNGARRTAGRRLPSITPRRRAMQTMRRGSSPPSASPYGAVDASCDGQPVDGLVRSRWFD